ncbi:MAG: hypothetical protein HY908_24915 [Myxococcales bacterium]|nr:hypothetical protein [Myxococcales bacterium]
MSEVDDTGPRVVPTPHGSHVELGEPVWVGGALPWACPAKLVGRDKRLPSLHFDDEDSSEAAPPQVAEPEAPESTHTLLLRTGRGRTPDEARRDAVRRVEEPLGKPAQIRPSDNQSPPRLRFYSDGNEVAIPPPPAPTDDAVARVGLLGRLWRRLTGR